MSCLSICPAHMRGSALADPGPHLLPGVEPGREGAHLACKVGCFTSVMHAHPTVSHNTGPQGPLGKRAAILADPGPKEDER